MNTRSFSSTSEISCQIRRGSLYSFVIFLAISALIAIGCVIFGEFGEIEVKFLMTTTFIAAASVCSLCCITYVQRNRKPLPGTVGICLAITTALLLIIGIWFEIESDAYFKVAAVFAVFSAAFAHSLALLTVQLAPIHKKIQTGVTIVIFLLATILSYMIFDESWEELTVKVAAVLAILIALGTLVIPILGRMNRGTESQDSVMLHSQWLSGDVYQDAAGNQFVVTKTNSAESTPPPHLRNPEIR